MAGMLAGHFYTYLWLREDGTPYYAGKGKGPRAFISREHTVHRPADSDRIILQEWPSEEAAFAAEKFLIACYGRKDNGTGCLRNLSDGGEGMSNPGEQTRRALSETARMRGISAETRRKMTEAHRGHRHSEEARRKMSAAHRGRSAETRRKISEAAKKRGISSETRGKMMATRNRRAGRAA